MSDFEIPDELIAEAKATAWDEVREFGFNEGRDRFAFGIGCGPDIWDCDCTNPYPERKSNE